MILALLALACLTPSADSLDTADSFGGERGALSREPVRANLLPGVDLDGDGYVSAIDCDDRNATVHRGAPEVCDGLDNDCDGLIDTADPSFPANQIQNSYPDRDGDQWGDDSANPRRYCMLPAAGWVTNNLDCDDADPTVPLIYAMDNDGDGCGERSPGLPVLIACEQPDGWVPNRTDCDDTDPTVCAC